MRCGDGNTKYFHASLASRRKSGISVLYDAQGRKLTTVDDIKCEVLSFYRSLLGTAASVTWSLDVEVVR